MLNLSTVYPTRARCSRVFIVCDSHREWTAKSLHQNQLGRIALWSHMGQWLMDILTQGYAHVFFVLNLVSMFYVLACFDVFISFPKLVYLVWCTHWRRPVWRISRVSMTLLPHCSWCWWFWSCKSICWCPQCLWYFCCRWVWPGWRKCRNNWHHQVCRRGEGVGLKPLRISKFTHPTASKAIDFFGAGPQGHHFAQVLGPRFLGATLGERVTQKLVADEPQWDSAVEITNWLYS